MGRIDMPKDPAVTRHVLSYFVRNPQAVDSLEGLARWRLLDEVVHLRVSETHEALAWLVERGILLQTEGPGRAPVFSLDPERKEEAERLLVESAADGDRLPRSIE
jgi:hypothetical protein